MASLVDFKNKVFYGGTHSITLDYGYTYKDGSFHKGVDLVTGRNVEDYVVAIEDGTVVNCANNISGQNTSTDTKGMGNYVILQHANGWRTRYQHMKYGSVTVTKGQTVKKGQKLGIIGNTGNSKGRHLHFDVSNSAKQSNSYVSGNRYYVDPKPFLKGTRSITGVKSEPDTAKTPAATSEYVKGTYKVTNDVNVRKGPGTSYAKVTYNDMTANAKAQVKNIAGKAVSYFPKGMSVTITEVNGAWGKCPSGWISLKYAKLVKGAGK